MKISITQLFSSLYAKALHFCITVNQETFDGKNFDLSNFRHFQNPQKKFDGKLKYMQVQQSASKVMCQCVTHPTSLSIYVKDMPSLQVSLKSCHLCCICNKETIPNRTILVHYSRELYMCGLRFKNL